MSDAVSVTVYTREDCTLCDDVIATAEELADSLSVAVAVETVDIDEDPDLREEYGERVPYVFVDGRPAGKYEIDERDLKLKILAAT